MKMEKHIGNIISKDEARQIVLHAIGREATEQELEETEVEFNEFNEMYLEDPEYQMRIQILTIPLYEFKDYDYPTMKIVIYTNGMVQYKNWSGCAFPMLEPLKIYEILASKQKEFEKLFER
jgi:cytochrome c biogenesis protein ResB